VGRKDSLGFNKLALILLRNILDHMKKFVDLENGYMHFESGVIIKENDKLEYVQGLNLGEEQNLLDVKTEWLHLNVRNIPFDGQMLEIRFSFFEGLLKSVDFKVDFSKKIKLHIATFASETYQKEIYKLNKIWFAEHIGKSDYYKWGMAFCDFTDYHGYGAVMGIKYGITSYKKKP